MVRTGYECDTRYDLRKTNVIADILSKKVSQITIYRKL